MARPTTPAVIDQTAIVGQTPEQLAAVEAQMQQQQQQVLAQYGNGGPYVREVYVSEIRRDMARTVEAILSIGRRLLVMKAHEGHGGWLECLRDIGVGEDGAQRMMLAARKIDGLPNTATSRYLIEAAGNSSKLFDLMSLPDDQLHDLVDGGALAGAKLDDIATMTVRELRAKLAEAKEELAAKDERAAAREQTIDRLTTDLRKARRAYEQASPSEQATELRTFASNAAFATRAGITAAGDTLFTRCTELLEHGREHGQDHIAFVTGLLNEVQASLDWLRAQLGIAAVTPSAEPGWIAEARAAGELN